MLSFFNLFAYNVVWTCDFYISIFLFVILFLAHWLITDWPISCLVTQTSWVIEPNQVCSCLVGGWGGGEGEVTCCFDTCEPQWTFSSSSVATETYDPSLVSEKLLAFPC